MTTHTHGWVYVGDILLEETSTHRAEFCLGCGTFRVNFVLGWSYLVPDCSKELLRDVDKIDHTYLGPADSLGPRPSRAGLGRGLKDIFASQPISRLDRLLKPKGK